MAVHTAYAGDGWQFETTLTDADGNDITALDDAWFSVYTDQDTEIVGYQLSDAEMTLAGNVITTIVPAVTTTAIADGTYYLDVKIHATGSIPSTVTRQDRVRCHNDSTLYDNY